MEIISDIFMFIFCVFLLNMIWKEKSYIKFDLKSFFLNLFHCHLQ